VGKIIRSLRVEVFPWNYKKIKINPSFFDRKNVIISNRRGVDFG
jgi:hypothetical protein